MFQWWKKRLIPVVLIRKEVGFNFLGEVKVIQLQVNAKIIWYYGRYVNSEYIARNLWATVYCA